MHDKKLKISLLKKLIMKLLLLLLLFKKKNQKVFIIKQVSHFGLSNTFQLKHINVYEKV